MTASTPARKLLLLAISLALSACASSGAKVPAKTRPVTTATQIRPAVARPARDPQLRMEPGLEGVIGGTRAQLIAQFGEPRLDVWEGDARKLQFTGTPCILDIFLYPTSQSREPVASYVDARRSDGRDVDKAACTRALRSQATR